MSSPSPPPAPIGTLQEGPLHAALKEWLAEPGDRFEVPVDGRQIDIVRGDLLIEIQTGALGPLRTKLRDLLAEHDVRVVHPVPREKWIVRAEGGEDASLGRRKSPKRGRVLDAFHGLVGIAGLLSHPRLSVEVLMTREEELRRHEPGRAWRRRGWVVFERRLLDVVDRRRFGGTDGWTAALPPDLPREFTTADLATAASVTRRVAQRAAYCLRAAGTIREVGKEGRSVAFARSVP